MDLSTLLALFQFITDPDQTPVSPAVIAASAELPREISVYDEIAREAFVRYCLSDESSDTAAYSRVEAIFRSLLKVDGRSESGCLRLALLAHANHCGDYGVNSLAGLANHFRTADHLTLPKDVFIAALEPLVDDDDLRHNALECLRALTLRDVDGTRPR